MSRFLRRSRRSTDQRPGSGLRRRGWVLAGLLGAGILVAGWSLLLGQAAPAPSPSLASLTVTSVIPHQEPWPKQLEATGEIAPWQEAIIGAQSSGLRIDRLHVAVGDVVYRGQLLASFDTATLRAEETQLIASLAQAQGAMAQAEANRTRALQLQDSGGISEQEVQRYVTEAITARAQLAGARAQLEAKRLQLRQADVLAPDDGLISSRTATLGAVANNGQELFRLVRQARLEWRGEFTATQLLGIREGQRVSLRLPQGQRAQGRVRQMAPLLDPQSRLGLVYVDLEPGSTARGGMYVDGAIALESSPALVVPAASVVIRDGRSIVFRLTPTGKQATVRAQQVVVGRRRGTSVEILQPLSLTEPIVAEGAGLLTDGDTVHISAAARVPTDAALGAGAQP